MVLEDMVWAILCSAAYALRWYVAEGDEEFSAPSYRD
jgi:hypothetical protein